MILHEIRTEHRGRSNTFSLVPLGDIHFGSRGCHVRKLKKAIEWIRANPTSYWVGMGDYFEAVKHNDKRFDPESIAPKYAARPDRMTDMAVEDLCDMLHPIRSQCIGLLTGNHEEKVRLRDGHDLHYRLTHRLGAKDLGYDALLRWTFARRADRGGNHPSRVLWVFASHGSIAGRSDGGIVTRMGNLCMNVDADLYLLGHGHRTIWFQKTTLRAPQSGAMHLEGRVRSFAMTGTYRRTYTEGTRDYGEKAHFPPSQIGSPKLTIRPWAEPERLVSWDIL